MHTRRLRYAQRCCDIYDLKKNKNIVRLKCLGKLGKLIVMTVAGFFMAITLVRANENVEKCPLKKNVSPPDYSLLCDYLQNGGTEIRNLNNSLTIGFLGSYEVALGALPLAISIVNNDPNFLPGWTLKFLAADIGQDDDGALHDALRIRMMMKMRDSGAVAFIGPDVHCKNEALVAAAWNLPLISHKCEDAEVPNPDVFHTFARTIPSTSKIGKTIVGLLRAYSWDKVVVLYSTAPSESDNKLNEYLMTYGINIIESYTVNDDISMYEKKFDDIVTETYRRARVYVFVGKHIALVNFVKCMQKRDLLYTGKYAIVSIDEKIYDRKAYKEITERDYINSYFPNQNMSEDVKFGFRSVLKLTSIHMKNPNFELFLKRIKEYSAEWPFCVPYNSGITNTIEERIPIQAAHLYDAVTIYARAVTEILRDGEDPRNGSAIQRRIRNRSYHSIQGYDVFVDKNGDAECNFTVVTLLEDPVKFDGKIKRSMQSVGYFHYNHDNSSDLPIFKYNNPHRGIEWIGKGPPTAEPECDFPGDILCEEIDYPTGLWSKINDWNDWKLHLALSALVGMVSISAMFAFKHYRYEQKLACILWKIKLNELTMLPDEPGDLQLINGKTSIYGCGRQTYTKVALYRGNVVAVKQICKKTMNISRSIRKELKQIREVRHQNLVTFIGAVVEPGTIFIVTSYCTRGSLRDILRNDDLRLDTMFLSYLIGDLLRGLIYLHDSEIGSHGNLRSTNCLVDSQWKLKISDFGLNEFKADHEDTNHAQKQQNRMLYMAPELLRNFTNGCRKGTQKGDVYSLSLILYEMMTRRDPWKETLKNPSEIIQEVRNGQFLRPDLDRLKAVPGYVKKCIAACWHEEPDKRPDMKGVFVILKPMQSALKANIIDNMIVIMQKYTCNLEDLVQERTNELMMEKEKTDFVLHRMLPRSVAESLKSGKPVEAESFDSVTILFSDIVRFTELAANSTPLQVITLLNELYTCYDGIISHYDVYKVETIGDAYMVVSGLPIKNGDNHAGEIASMALHLLKQIRRFEIPHRPGEGLQVRIGIHSGQCVAGVVGLKMPRYCLFGDTVNTASRMESTGLPLKIHMSEETWTLLQKGGGYEAEERGLIHIKGKGPMKTYWLLHEDPLQRKNRTCVSTTHFPHSHFGSSYSILADVQSQNRRDSTSEHNFKYLVGGIRA